MTACARCRELERHIAELTAQLQVIREARRAASLRGYYRDKESPRGREQRKRHGAKQRKKAQATTLDAAVNRRKPWTDRELEVAARDDLTAREVAAMLGRSFYAVKTVREKLYGARSGKAAS